MFEKLAEKMKAKNRAISEEEEIEFKNLDEATEATFERPQPTPDPKAETKPSAIEGGNLAIKVSRPKSYDEVSSIADYLLEGCTVFLNTDLIDKATTIRMFDFLNGVTYTMGGEIKNVSPDTFIITPRGIDFKN